MSTGHAEVFQGKDGQWYWRIRANNNETVAQSEGYQTRAGALEGFRDTQHAVENPLIDAGD